MAIHSSILFFFYVFIELVTILVLVYVFIFHKACGILVPRPGIEPAPPVVEGRVLTIGPPGKSHHSSILSWRTPWTKRLVGYSPWGHKESDTPE